MSLVDGHQRGQGAFLLPAGAAVLISGVTLAALTEAVAGTVLSLGRLDMLGDVHATLDEFARLDVAYVWAKLVAVLAAPWLMARLGPLVALRAATALMTLSCGGAALTSDLSALVGLRLMQGGAGGILLVAGQTLLFRSFPRALQPLVQAIFAVAAVVAPATLTPYLHGSVLDRLSWAWIFLSVVPVGTIALGLLVAARETEAEAARSLDATGLLLFAAAALCLTWVLSQGSRWSWFEEPLIASLTLIGVAALILFLASQRVPAGAAPLVNAAVFRDAGFAFGFVASFAAGFALAGSTFLISAFAVSILGMTPTEAGWLLLPGALTFVGALALSALLIGRRGLPPVATVPLGIACFVGAMWMLSGSTAESGADLAPAILLRGLALGFLFLSITLITLNALDSRAVASGVGLFNAGRQTGGLVGVAFLETLIDHRAAESHAALGAYAVPGRIEVMDRLALLSAGLMRHGLDAASAAKAAAQLLGGTVAREASVVAFNDGFLAVAIFFFVAAPALVAAKLAIGRLARRRRGRR